MPGPRSSGYSKSSTRLEDVSPHTESAIRNTFSLKFNIPALSQVSTNLRPPARTSGRCGAAWPPGLRAQEAAGEGRSGSAAPRPERARRDRQRSALGPPRPAPGLLPNLPTTPPHPRRLPESASYLSEDEAGRSGAPIGSFQPAPPGRGASGHLDSTHGAREKPVRTEAWSRATTPG